tara:strand:- start:314 stop:628 length:315 start_codon:yes stop_codon:yes gene_type:complete
MGQTYRMTEKLRDAAERFIRRRDQGGRTANELATDWMVEKIELAAIRDAYGSTQNLRDSDKLLRLRWAVAKIEAEEEEPPLSARGGICDTYGFPQPIGLYQLTR